MILYAEEGIEYKFAVGMTLTQSLEFYDSSQLKGSPACVVDSRKKPIHIQKRISSFHLSY